MIKVKPITGQKTYLRQAAEECFKDYPLLKDAIYNKHDGKF